MEKAPEVPGWRIVAIRQRKPLNFALEVGAITLEPNDIHFTFEVNLAVVSLTLYIPERLNVPHEQVLWACFVLLGAAPGEYDAETRVGVVNVTDPADAPETLRLQPLMELPHLMDQMAARE